MKRKRLGLVLMLLVVCAMNSWGQTRSRIQLKTESDRRETVRRLQAERRATREKAHRVAREKGWVVRAETPEATVELKAIRDGRPVYLVTYNKNAAISTAADLVRSTPPYNVDGTGVLVGVWDAGAVLRTHQELTGRVSVRDAAPAHAHATHVAGVIAATGLDANAKGMAPAVLVDSYDWDEDDVEMTAAAATAPLQANKVYISNHAYGILAGWETNGNVSGNDGLHWHGDFSQLVDPAFGQYSFEASIWDEIAYNAQYYLPFKASGSHRGDNAPAEGTLFYYYDGSAWISKNYAAATDPPSDQAAGGYNTITDAGNAKNVLTVGEVQDAVAAGVRSLGAAAMVATSGWGPTDDGRIKPDIVANGVDVYSATTGASNQEYEVRSGSSYAAANACGSAALLVEYYNDLFASDMRASTLKGLILHTADDLGNAGPDYSFGWGLMNVKAAADQIKNHSDFPTDHFVIEGTRTAASTNSYSFYWDGVSEIRATLCWTDPAAADTTAHNAAAAMLKNDLDLRITHSVDATVHQPYVLNPGNRSAAATRGDNTLDNVEQVSIASPPSSGIFTMAVTHKGTLTNGSQKYSIILSGQLPMPDISTTGGPFNFGDHLVGSATQNPQSVVIRNLGTNDLLFTFAGIAVTGTNANQFVITNSPSIAALSPGQSRVVNVAFQPQDPGGLGAQSASLTITTNDPDEGTVQIALSGNGVAGSPLVANFSAPSTNRTENEETLQIAVGLSEPAGAGGVSVWYTVNPASTASGGGQDYTLTAPGELSFAQGVQNANISVPIKEDSVDEENQTIILQLTNPSGVVIGSQGVHTITIQDDDAAPTVAFASPTVTVNEGNARAQLTVQLSGNATEKTVTVQATTSDKTAKAGEDYTALSRLVTIMSPATSKQVLVSITNDSKAEAQEEFQVQLGASPQNATLGSPKTVTVQIEASDLKGPLAGVKDWYLY